MTGRQWLVFGVEEGDSDWKGEVGMVTKLIDQMEISPEDTYAIVCGPPVVLLRRPRQ